MVDVQTRLSSTLCWLVHVRRQSLIHFVKPLILQWCWTSATAAPWTPTREPVSESQQRITTVFSIFSSSISTDMEEHFGSLSRDAAGLFREGVFLQRGHAGILLRPRPRNVPAHLELLPHWEAPLPATRVHPGLRWRAGLLRHRARDHRRLLHGGKPRPPVDRKQILWFCVSRMSESRGSWFLVGSMKWLAYSGRYMNLCLIGWTDV